MRTLTYIFLAGFLIGCGGDFDFPDTRECKFCKEEVKVGALKCKHCGEDPYDGDGQARTADIMRDRIDEAQPMIPIDTRPRFDEEGRDRWPEWKDNMCGIWAVLCVGILFSGEWAWFFGVGGIGGLFFYFS